MKTYTSSGPGRSSAVKQWLPYFVLVAVTINSGLIVFFIDLAAIATTSLASLFNIDFKPSIEIAHQAEVLNTIRTYANIILIVSFLLIVLKSTKEKS